MNAALRRLLAALLVIALVSPLRAAPAVDESAVESATFLLQRAVSPTNDRAAHELLRALRHLRDPALRPLYEKLAASPRPAQQVHGLLGLAEIAAPRRLDLARVVAMTEPVAQAEVISAALADELIGVEECRQVVASTGLDPSVRLLAACELVKRKAVDAAALRPLLQESAASDNFGRRALAGLLMLQVGDAQGQGVLNELAGSADPKRDDVCAMILDTALRHELAAVGPWAMTLASGATDARLQTLALRAALRFGAPGAADLWKGRFAAANEPAEQVRLAIALLRLAPWVSADLFDAIRSDDPLLQRIADASRAIATRQNIAPAVVKLVELHHAVADRAAMEYANEHAAVEDGVMILFALVLAYEQAPDNLKPRALDDALMAAQLLHDKSPPHAATLLRPLVGSATGDARLAQAVVLGLIRSQEPGAAAVVQGLPLPTNPQLLGVFVVLLSKGDAPLDAAAMNELALAVRGGGRLQETLRVQAGWNYLKRVGRDQAALASVLRP